MCASNRRPFASSDTQEVILNTELAAAASSTAESVAHGHSVLLLTAVASSEECATLRKAASTAAASERASRGLSGLVREPIEALLREDALSLALCDALLVRQHTVLTKRLPSLVAALYGSDGLSSTTCLRNERLVWSPGEPALNVYTPGGHFTPHADEQSLTCLLNLSEQGDYVGGGTAFWSSVADAPVPGDGGDDDASGDGAGRPPTRLLVPPVGTALVFGGTVKHAGQPISAGERCVLVASCSLAGHDCFVPFEEALTERGDDAAEEECTLEELCAALGGEPARSSLAPWFAATRTEAPVVVNESC